MGMSGKFFEAWGNDIPAEQDVVNERFTAAANLLIKNMEEELALGALSKERIVEAQRIKRELQEIEDEIPEVIPARVRIGLLLEKNELKKQEK